MKHLQHLFAMKRRLPSYARSLGLTYDCDVKLIDYEPAETVVEESGTYDYPEMFHVAIESWSTFKVTFRIHDGRWIREGQDLNAVGLTTAQMYRRVRNNLRAHARHIAESKGA